MKIREFKDAIKQASVDDLKQRRLALADELMRGRFRAATGQAPAGQSLGQLRRQLARVETELRARVLSDLI